MVGQALLGAASLLTQGLFNVETMNDKRPLSLYLLTLGDSGDGKSTAQGAALAPVNDWQRDRAREFSLDLKDFERVKVNRKKGDDPPEAPPCPFRLVGDATVEGLRRDLDSGVCAQGVFTDEAAAILSGYGMSAALVAYSIKTWQAIIDEGAADQRGADALRMYEYLTTRDEWCETLATIVNGGPSCVRSKARRDAALSVLEDVGLVSVADGRATALLASSARAAA